MIHPEETCSKALYRLIWEERTREGRRAGLASLKRKTQKSMACGVGSHLAWMKKRGKTEREDERTMFITPK